MAAVVKTKTRCCPDRPRCKKCPVAWKRLSNAGLAERDPDDRRLYRPSPGLKKEHFKAARATQSGVRPARTSAGVGAELELAGPALFQRRPQNTASQGLEFVRSGSICPKRGEHSIERPRVVSGNLCVDSASQRVDDVAEARRRLLDSERGSPCRADPCLRNGARDLSGTHANASAIASAQDRRIVSTSGSRGGSRSVVGGVRGVEPVPAARTWICPSSRTSGGASPGGCAARHCLSTPRCAPSCEGASRPLGPLADAAMRMAT